MKHNTRHLIFAFLLCATLLLSSVISTAHADPGEWLLPWETFIQNGLSVTIDFTNVNSATEQKSYKVRNRTLILYAHILTIRVKNNTGYRQTLEVYAPASGTVLGSDNDYLAVETTDDVYEFRDFDGLYDGFEAGDYIQAGQIIGMFSISSSGSQNLYFDYLVSRESSTLFGAQKKKFTTGANLTEISTSSYDSSHLSTSSSSGPADWITPWKSNVVMWIQNTNINEGGKYGSNQLFLEGPGYSSSLVLIAESLKNVRVYSPANGLTCGDLRDDYLFNLFTLETDNGDYITMQLKLNSVPVEFREKSARVSAGDFIGLTFPLDKSNDSTLMMLFYTQLRIRTLFDIDASYFYNGAELAGSDW